MTSIKDACPNCGNWDNRCICTPSPEQRFTDEEVKTLLRELNSTEHGKVVTISIPASDLHAILSRLKAAEEICWDLFGKSNSKEIAENKLMKAWRKVVGK